MITTSISPEYSIKILDMQRDSSTGFVSRVIWDMTAKYVGITTEEADAIVGVSTEKTVEEVLNENTYVSQVFDQIVLEREYDEDGNLVPLPDDFIEFENLSEEIVLSWVDNHIDEERLSVLKYSLNKKITDKLQPKTLSGTPW